MPKPIQPSTQTDDLEMEDRQLDRCQFCLGFKGGTLGSEVVMQGVLVCVSCSELACDIFEAMQRNAVIAPPPGVMTGEAEDPAASSDGALIRAVNDRAHDHAAQEASGALVSLVQPFGSNVTDPDEAAMYRQLAALNISVCPECYLTGWKLENEILCECPVGGYLAKRIAKRAAP